MGSTQEAIDVFEKSREEKGSEGIWYAPGKAANWYVLLSPLPSI